MQSKQQHLKRRHQRVRKKIKGTKMRPRLFVYRGLKHIYASLVDDKAGRTLITVSDLKYPSEPHLPKAGKAREVGKAVAVKAKSLGISKVVFDRGGRAYHGRIKALAEGAREGGLGF
jgi:large subunit ribosomal protein L18